MLEIEDFGRGLLRTGDLDPVYVALWGGQLPRPQLHRWLTAYWMFYHMGMASWLSEKEGDNYWIWVRAAAKNASPPPVGGVERWPRMAERRHFRGEKCVKAVEWFARRDPEYWVESLLDATTQGAVMDRVKAWPLHGPWIAFKAADMLERVVEVPMRVDPNIGLIYSEPRKALDMLVDSRGGHAEGIYSDLLHTYLHETAPPRGERPVGPLEVETILCKWKSHTNGHYTVGKDIREVRHALTGWGETAERLLAAAPQEVEGW